MKKKILNLAVAMSVIASSLVFSSCGDDDDEDEAPKQEQQNSNNQGSDNQGNQGNDNQGSDNQGNDNQGTSNNIGEPQTSVTVAEGDTFLISNAQLGIKDKKMYVATIFRDQIVLNVYGTLLYMGSTNDNRPYAIKFNSDGSPSACYYKDASQLADKVLFVCQDGFVIASGTLDSSTEISSKAGETTFRKVN